MLNPYVKAVIAAIIALAGALGTGYDDSVLTTSEIFVAIAAGVVALGAVWATPIGKAVVGAVVTGIATLGVALSDDKLSAQEVTTVIVAVLTALSGIYTLKNTSNGSPTSTQPV